MIKKGAAILWLIESASMSLAPWSGFYWIGQQQPAIGETGNLGHTDEFEIKILLLLYH